MIVAVIVLMLVGVRVLWGRAVDLAIAGQFISLRWQQHNMVDF